ncbi:MAG TPA: hypothetical protein VGD64_12840 [Acidisarcina sp.]
MASTLAWFADVDGYPDVAGFEEPFCGVAGPAVVPGSVAPAGCADCWAGYCDGAGAGEAVPVCAGEEG